MKKLTLIQRFNPKYVGEHTPDEPKSIYVVEHVINSTTPQIHETLSQDEAQNYCDNEDWQVTIS